MKLFYLLSAVAISNVCWAQDPQFTQVYLSKVYLNPAYTGINNDLTISNNNRFQWGKVTPQVAPFRTHDVSADLGSPWLGIGTGISFFYDREGEGNLTTTSVRVPVSYYLNVGKESFISFGLQGAFGHKSIDWSKLVFSDQLDPIYGNINPSAALPWGVESENYLNFNAGVLYQANYSQFNGSSQKKSNGSRFTIGIAMHNMSKAKVSLIGNSDSYVPRRYTVHGFTNITLNNKATGDVAVKVPRILSIGGIWEGHQSLLESPGSFNTTSFVLSYTINSSMLLGLGYSNKQFLKRKSSEAFSVNFIILAQQTKGFDVVLGTNYDFTLASLGMSNTMGTIELSIVIKLRGVRLTPPSATAKMEAKKKIKKGCENLFDDMYRDQIYRGKVNFGMYYLP